MPSRGSNTPKRKHVTLSVNQKLELIRKLEAGASVARVCDEYGVKKQTVSDIRKAKDKLTAFSLKYTVDANSKSSSVGARKRMRVAKDTNLEEAVTKWFMQQRSCGNVVHGVEIQAAAAKLASHMGIENFEASDGWL
ncbi:Tigger transposable element-derived protein 7-like 47 [Homarus americanus]|uniref:Tigger transposable element-derived protein 7-like 47 n=1 Tax=Homarus americanus TaxID=6706 RepID=A0A8J5MLB8_HOMAM|nr:Tigger transposable element-derived protein 7-like 47 [Homarus americanus]